ncbi:MAG: FumA C-terminus/TtdB family hydratase beta subunit [Candidatus Bathyarchaeota archaeon]|nr:FumA C-terminus/TtdB family hydratase beta subunit [Candidatus Bathyarchaeota archaeon]
MAVFRFRTPVSEADVRKLRVNDVVYLSGLVVTARDQAHRRALAWADAGKLLPVDLRGAAVFHCGPVMRRVGEGWEAVAAGPTTSTRLESVEPQFLDTFKPRVIIGKGGMGEQTLQALSRVGAIYCAFTGGAAVLAAQAIKQVKAVKWLDLGMPEALWILQTHEFGPLTVAMDTHKNSLFAQVTQKTHENQKQAYKKLHL